MSFWAKSWVGEWSGYPLDCFDYTSTCGAFKRAKYRVSQKNLMIEFFEVRHLWALLAILGTFRRSGHFLTFLALWALLGTFGYSGHFWATWSLLGTLGTFWHSQKCPEHPKVSKIAKSAQSCRTSKNSIIKFFLGHPVCLFFVFSSFGFRSPCAYTFDSQLLSQSFHIFFLLIIFLSFFLWSLRLHPLYTYESAYFWTYLFLSLKESPYKS